MAALLSADVTKADPIGPVPGRAAAPTTPCLGLNLLARLAFRLSCVRRSDAVGRAMGRVEAPGGSLLAEGQGTATGSGVDDVDQPLAASERAKWRAIPADLGPWWRAAQVFM